MQKRLTIPEIGIVLITKKSNATKIKLRVHPVKGVLITIPYGIPFKHGEIFLYKNIDWLKEKLCNQQQNKQSNFFTPESLFYTRTLSLKFIPFDGRSLKAEFKNLEILFYYNPDLVNFYDKTVQDFIKKFILKCLKLEAQEYLTKRAYSISKTIGIYYNKISIGTAETRWGSCNSNNEIILSCRLMLLPSELIDYVILHELCHVVHKNHGKDFHKLLNKLTNEKSNKFNKILKTYSVNIVPGDYQYK